jgi:hypothetical protein
MQAKLSIVRALPVRLVFILMLAAIVISPAVAFAQHDHAAMMAAADARWKWTVDATGTLNLNIQQRKFTDFTQVESQNFLMLMGGKKLPKGQLSVHTMFSFEPFTLRDLGSSQAFQTGETFDRRPLIDYQHPHDLFMGLGATWTVDAGKIALRQREIRRRRSRITLSTPPTSPTASSLPASHIARSRSKDLCFADANRMKTASISKWARSTATRGACGFGAAAWPRRCPADI